MSAEAQFLDNLSINRAALQELIDAVGMDGVSTLIDLFTSEFPGSVQACLGAIEAGDAEGARAQAHPMKSSARYLGAYTLSDLCVQIEASARNRDLAKLREQAPKLSLAFQEAEESLRMVQRLHRSDS